jgi:rhomboid family GlyGly-CTERM serine protease
MLFMDPAQSQSLTRRIPIITLCVAGGALMVAMFPEWSARLIYDRQAILAGQLWRLFTGHWVHFSTSHLGYDVLALVIVGWIAETEKLPRLGWLCLVAPWLIGVGLLVFEPRLEYYGGLSALAVTMIVYTALHGLHCSRGRQAVCTVALLAFGGKLCFELATGRMLFASVGGATPVMVSATSHLFGALIGGLFYIGDRRLKGSACRTVYPARQW